MTHTQFTLAAMTAVVTAFNSVPTLAYSLSDRHLDIESLVFSLQEGTSAIVVHLLPDGRHDVLVVGNPSLDARCVVNRVCQAIAHEWRMVQFPAVGAVNASVECLRNEA